MTPVAVLLLAAPAAGPPAPGVADRAAAAATCRPGPRDDITVCAARRPPSYRLPLPDDRARSLAGAPGRAEAGDSPVRHPPATGVTFTLRDGRPVVTGNGRVPPD